MNYEQIYDGQWVAPKRKYFYEKCCDCGLVHKVEFKVVNHRIWFRAWRIPRRRKKKPIIVKQDTATWELIEDDPYFTPHDIIRPEQKPSESKWITVERPHYINIKE